MVAVVWLGSTMLAPAMASLPTVPWLILLLVIVVAGATVAGIVNGAANGYRRLTPEQVDALRSATLTHLSGHDFGDAATVTLDPAFCRSRFVEPCRWWRRRAAAYVFIGTPSRLDRLLNATGRRRHYVLELDAASLPTTVYQRGRALALTEPFTAVVRSRQ